MRVAETLIDGDPARYEQRYTVHIGSVPMHFVRRPVTTPPDEGTICFADNGPRLGTIPRQGVACFKGGGWSGIKFQPTHWVWWDGEEGKAGG